MINPIWQLAHMSMWAGLWHGDLEETCFTKERIGTVARSRAFDKSTNQRFENGIVFAVVQALYWTPQCLYINDYGMLI